MWLQTKESGEQLVPIQRQIVEEEADPHMETQKI
jgi:hypothetical protein